MEQGSLFNLLLDLAPVRNQIFIWFGGLRFLKKLGSLFDKSCLVGLIQLICFLGELRLVCSAFLLHALLEDVGRS